MRDSNTRLGVTLMTVTMAIFAIQDVVSRHLADEYNVWMVVMVRYWFFGGFALTIAARRAGGLRNAAHSAQPWVQAFRGALLVAEICVMIVAFIYLGLVEAHAIFACYPLLVAALSGPVLGESVGWRRWAAIGVGFIGILVILQPGSGVFEFEALIALCAAIMFALYTLLTRHVARDDTSATSFFYTGTVGALAITPIGLFFWEQMTMPDWGLMALLCVSGATGHYMLIKVYEAAEASAVQPFAYLQLVFASAAGVFILGETIRPEVVIGVLIVVSAGLFTLWRERVVVRR
ncbi:DMT family transporter [Oceaniglobus ichthyenteri]|uniref:DMT family transporter n=1 Tax=Oceaniglobus ichthyenteri TaxID=2136177 RepID=UPI000D37F80D|nr:DMT family transporter [Oceaniglobus ichthyenteri]